jgi:hypothetical protein
MSINEDIFRAILAMDSYNRGNSVVKRRARATAARAMPRSMIQDRGRLRIG